MLRTKTANSTQLNPRETSPWVFIKGLLWNATSTSSRKTFTKAAGSILGLSLNNSPQSRLRASALLLRDQNNLIGAHSSAASRHPIRGRMDPGASRMTVCNFFKGCRRPSSNEDLVGSGKHRKRSRCGTADDEGSFRDAARGMCSGRRRVGDWDRDLGWS